jgi:acyl carrier protein
LVHRFADWLALDPKELSPGESLLCYGLDSVSAVTYALYLEQELGVELEASVIWDNPTLEQLAAHLADRMTHRGVAALPGA